MKTLGRTLVLSSLLTVGSQAATSITGVAGASFKGTDGTTNIPSGSLVMLVVDNGGNGFLNQASGGAIEAGVLTGATGKTITPAQASFTVGGTFGGDTIVSVSTSGSGSIGGILTGVDITPYINLNFAIVYFSDTLANVQSSASGKFFGMMRLSDWTFPASDSGATFTMSATDASGAGSFFSTSAATTATQVGAGGFFTGSGAAANAGSTAVRSTTFQIVPEPSAALLGAIGALGLLRRRRI